MHAMYLSVTGELEFPIPWPSRRVGVRKEHRDERHHRLGLNPASPQPPPSPGRSTAMNDTTGWG